MSEAIFFLEFPELLDSLNLSTPNRTLAGECCLHKARVLEPRTPGDPGELVIQVVVPNTWEERTANLVTTALSIALCEVYEMDCEVVALREREAPF